MIEQKLDFERITFSDEFNTEIVVRIDYLTKEVELITSQKTYRIPTHTGTILVFKHEILLLLEAIKTVEQKLNNVE